MKLWRLVWGSLICVLLSPLPASPANLFDIAPFARPCCVRQVHSSPVEFDYPEAQRPEDAAQDAIAGRSIYGWQWAEERDVSAVRLHFRSGSRLPSAILEYWFSNWPYPPPKMPTIEDPVDDPWQGRWLKAAIQSHCQQDTCVYTFAPLTETENPLARNLPGVTYRRTLKVRLRFKAEAALEKVEVFSGSTEKHMEVRLQLGAGENGLHTWDGRVEIYNGRVESVQLWSAGAYDAANVKHFHVVTRGLPKGFILRLVVTEPSLPGSNDISIVTLRAGDRTFSFATPDLLKGPVYVPDFHVYVSLTSDPRPFSPEKAKSGERIRVKLAKEPEQTYERARSEIPGLDPTVRDGERLYLPLAADASWQKFAFEWGGNIHISKEGTKAKGKESKRLEWQGDRIGWQIGTGATPSYRSQWKDSTLSVLDDYLPIATAKWTTEGIEYSEEGFATLLSGPLGPDDPGRNEQTPAVLMIKLAAHNPGSAATIAHVWLATSPVEKISYENGELWASEGQLLRAQVRWPGGTTVAPAKVPNERQVLEGIHGKIALKPGEEKEIFIRLPYVPRLTGDERTRFAQLDYHQEFSRARDYWQSVVDGVVPFDVPEQRFDNFAKAVLAHLRISATKDPASGFYMLPAASYYYQVYANEAAFQCVMLDALGDHALAAEYLKTFAYFQGSKMFDGTYTSGPGRIYHGVRVNEDYDYTASQYNLDHGAVLWAFAEHYFYTRDKDWLGAYGRSMKQAADWIIEQRGRTRLLDDGEKIPEYGLLPTGHLEDNADWGHWFAVNDFASAGMTRLAEALADAGDPSARHYTQEAAAFRQDLRDAIMRAAQAAPVVRLRDSTYVPWFGPRPYERIRLYGPNRVAFYSRYPEKVLPTFRLSETREVLYGPMIHLTLNIFGPEEPVASWVLDDWEDNATMSSSMGLNVHGWVDDAYWFSRGGMVFQANLQNPVLAYLRRHEIPAAVRNLYNDFVACHYPGANTFTEEFRQWAHASGPFYKTPDEARFVNRLRDMLALEDGETLWLASGTPRRWLEPGQKITVHGMATYFGPVSYTMEAAQHRINVTVQLPSRDPYKTAWLVVRVPDARPLRAVQIDGEAWEDFDAAQEWVRLPHKPGEMRVIVDY